jgi:hypothetical protein
MSLDRALLLHDQAVDALVSAVSSVPPERWVAPYQEGKWSPGEITAHLVATWDVLLQELGGGPGMAMRTNWWQRVLLRLLLLPRLLAGKSFPRNAKAPRETRPAAPLPDREAALAAIGARAKAIPTQSQEAAAHGRVLTHAYFGKGPIDRGIVLAARHVQHHTAQIQMAAGHSQSAATDEREEPRRA